MSVSLKNNYSTETGHFEFHACPIQPGEVPTQACFDSHPLSFVSGEGAPPDPNYPVRAYLPPSKYNLKYQYRLPPALSGDLVLIQWYYVTANSCMDAGYDSYDFPVGWYPGTSTCPSIPPDGRGLPEQFWNCAEVRIVEDCGGDDGPPVTTTEAPVTTTAATSVATTTTETPAVTTTEGPVEPPTTTTSAVTTNMPDPDCRAKTEDCGPSITCDSAGFPGRCCSQWGYCGVMTGHCGVCCQNGPCENNSAGPVPPVVTTERPMEPPVTTTTNLPNPDCPAKTKVCGPSITCDSVDFPGMCCSQWGYCGAMVGYCGGDCCQNGPCENNNDGPV